MCSVYQCAGIPSKEKDALCVEKRYKLFSVNIAYCYRKMYISNFTHGIRWATSLPPDLKKHFQYIDLSSSSTKFVYECACV